MHGYVDQPLLAGLSQAVYSMTRTKSGPLGIFFDLLFGSDTSDGARLLFILCAFDFINHENEIGIWWMLGYPYMSARAATVRAHPRQGIGSIPQPKNRKRRSGRRIGGVVK